jgi:hypothetical protein
MKQDRLFGTRMIDLIVTVVVVVIVLLAKVMDVIIWLETR